MQELHARHVIDEHLCSEKDNNTFSIHLDGGDAGRESQLADGGVFLGIDDAETGRTYGRIDDGDEGRRKQHLRHGDGVLCTCIAAVEGVAVEDGKRLLRRCGKTRFVLVEAQQREHWRTDGLKGFL